MVDQSKENPSSTCEITREGVLIVTIPLEVPNGEIMAYGVLHKAQQFVAAYATDMKRRAKEAAIIRPVGSNGGK